MSYQVGQRYNQQKLVDTSSIHELVKMNPPSFTGSSVTEDPQKFIEDLKNIFDVMHVAEDEREELGAYQKKGVPTIWFYQWKKTRV